MMNTFVRPVLKRQTLLLDRDSTLKSHISLLDVHSISAEDQYSLVEAKRCVEPEH